MSSFQQINELRKAGRLEEAYLLAQQALAQDKSVWNNRAMSWVLYGLLKNAEATQQPNEAMALLQEIAQLELPADETMFWEKIPWLVGKLVFNIPEDSAAVSLLTDLFTILQKLPFKTPGDGYSFMLKAFLKKGKQWDGLPHFIEWWGFESFVEKDFVPAVLPNGKRGLALAEQTLIAFARHLLDDEGEAVRGGLSDKSRIERFLPVLQRISTRHPEYRYATYYNARLLRAIERTEEAILAFLPFARQKKEEYWVWDTLSDLFHMNPDLQFACLCKALTCRMDDKFSVKLRRKVVPFLLDRGETALAASQVHKLADIYAREGWHIPGDVSSWLLLPWAQEHTEISEHRAYFQSLSTDAEQLLYADAPEEILLVRGINIERNLLYFISAQGNQGNFNTKSLKVKLTIGDVFRARIITEHGHTSAFAVQHIPATEVPDTLIKHFSGTFKQGSGQPFGFVGALFVPPALVQRQALVNGQKVTGMAFRTWDKQKTQLGWRVEQIQKCEPRDTIQAKDNF